MKNTAIAKVFQDIADLPDLKGEFAFNIRAYQKAARPIEHYPRELKIMLEEGPNLPVTFWLSIIGVTILSSVRANQPCPRSGYNEPAADRSCAT